MSAQVPVLRPAEHLVLVDANGVIVARDIDPSPITRSPLRFDFGDFRNFQLQVSGGEWVRWTEKRRYYTGLHCTGSEYAALWPPPLTDVVAFVDEAGVLWAGRYERVLIASSSDGSICTNSSAYEQVGGARVSPLLNLVEAHPEPLRFVTVERTRAVAR